VAETMEADASKAGQSSKHRLRIVLPSRLSSSRWPALLRKTGSS
jgi:hypothetical protein